MQPRLPLLGLCLLPSLTFAAPDGKALFEQNCAACHLPDQMQVGPSLVEIRGLYEKDTAGFLKWAVSPQKKRPNLIEMPSMAHVGEPGLLAIHAYILSITKGLKEKKANGNKDEYAVPPAQFKHPFVQRIFLPDSGPASIAVALPGEYSYAWDAGPCRLRYVWQGGFINGYPYWKANGSSQAEIVGKIVLKEEVSLWGKETPKFLGYILEAGLPTFRYRVGEGIVSETPRTGQGKLTRHFTLQPARSLVLNVSPGTTSDSGKPAENTLTLTEAEVAKGFTLSQPLP